MMTRHVSLTIAALAATAALSCASVGAAAPTLRGVFVGRVAGTHAFVAVAVGHGQARAYLCDSRRLGVWLPLGTLRAGRLDLQGSRVHLTGSVRRSGAEGTVTLADGARHAFHALFAPRNGRAGLYRAVKTVHGTRDVAGWILLRGGAQRGEVVKLNININTASEEQAVGPAPQLAPQVATVEIPDAGELSARKVVIVF
jgi:hypothetical protein